MNRTGPAALSLGALLLLASCSGDDADAKPSPSPSPSPSTSASPSPSETPPPMPAQAREDSHAGASALVGYFVEALTYAAHTGDTQPIRSVSAPECVGCNEYITTFRDKRSTRLEWSVVDMEVTSDDRTVGLLTNVSAVEDDGPTTYKIYFEVDRADRKVTVMSSAS